MIALLIALVHRLNTTAADQISNISILRYTNITAQWGASANDTVSAPNWGQMLWHEVNIIPDYVGEIGWMVLFSIPFIMLWVGTGEIMAAAAMGIFLGIFMFAYIGSGFAYIGVGLIALGIAGIIWSLYQKRG